jgi:hypothetical protein
MGLRLAVTVDEHAAVQPTFNPKSGRHRQPACTARKTDVQCRKEKPTCWMEAACAAL